MDFSAIINLLKRRTSADDQPKKRVKFVAEESGNCCEKCRSFNGKIFAMDDPQLPKLPLHPNCRCQLVDVKDLEKKKREKVKEIIKTVPEAAQTGVETALLPMTFGETIGAVKIATVLFTSPEIRAIGARNTLITSNKIDENNRSDLYSELGSALAKKDLRTILKLDNKYKQKQK